MTKHRLLIFVDCNVLIAALFVPQHAAQAIASLAYNKQIDLICSELVLKDVEDEVLEQCEHAGNAEVIDAWQEFKERIRLRVMLDPESSVVDEIRKKYLGIMRHNADIPVLASAIQLKPDLILSDNDQHFNQAVAERCGLPIMTCRDFLVNLVNGSLQNVQKTGV